jgi:PadR family transcriptional regulator PadR
MGKTGALGSFEEMVLLAVLRLAEHAYSVPIRRELSERSSSEISMGAVYATLDRLQAKGLIDERREAPQESTPGRPRKYYSVSREGISALDETRRIRERMWRGLTLGVSDADGTA